MIYIALDAFNYSVVVGEQYKESPITNLRFPLPADLVNYTRSEDISTITVPQSLIQERLEEVGENGRSQLSVFPQEISLSR